ncbi:MAG: GGDEF domain-containing phosphodiesterase [Eubacterium sp.]|nr:GGDEF domain-containing phosphodiesterase [Eubacterium sp.]
MKSEIREKYDKLVHGMAGFQGGYLIIEGEQVVYSNNVIWDMFECHSEDEFLRFIGGTFYGMIYPEDTLAVEQNAKKWTRSSQEGYNRISGRIVTKEGSIKYAEGYGHMLEGEDEQGLILVYVFAQDAHYDRLTALSSMTFFLDNADGYVNHFYECGENPVMINFNLNSLKMYNLKYSVRAGNELLISFARMLVKYFGHDYCARFGEDHFYVVASFSNMKECLDKLFWELSVYKGGLTLSCRAGIYVFEKEDIVKASVACERARIASNSAEKSRESQAVYFEKQVGEAVWKKDYIIHNVYEAVDRGYLTVYYQPQVFANSEKMHGFEALVRWVDPNYGMISPGEFIPILEEYSLTYIVDQFVMEQIARDMLQARKYGKDLVPISFNLSRTDFMASDPYHHLVQVVKTYNLSRDLFKVEITESTVMSNPDKLKYEIKRFRDGGFEVLMDDFGNAYSSLSTLRDFEFDTIKIDMGFMRNFSERSKNIIRPMIMMAKGLGIHTVAEGVETKEQLEFLRDAGCEVIQGYYYGKPLPFEQACDMVERHMFLKSDTENQPELEISSDISFTRADSTQVNEQVGIINAMAAVYNSIHVLDLEEDTYEEIRASYALHQFLGAKGQTSKEIIKIMRALCTPEYMERLLAFVDMKTIGERLKDRDYIEMDFLGELNGWTNAAFFVLKRDTDKNPTQALFTTRVINERVQSEIDYKHVIAALKNVYLAMVQLDLKTKEFTPVFMPDFMTEKVGKGRMPYETARRIGVEQYVDDEYKVAVKEFLSVATVAKRLDGKKYLSTLYYGTAKRWRRIIYTVSKTDEQGNPLQLFLAIEDLGENINSVGEIPTSKR